VTFLCGQAIWKDMTSAVRRAFRSKNASPLQVTI
jgi:hypothetical protein